MSGKAQKTGAGSSWDQAIDIDDDEPVQAKAINAGEASSSGGDVSPQGDSLQEAIDVDAPVDEPDSADELVPYYVCPEDKQDDNQQQDDQVAAPVTSEDCFELAHAVTWAFIEKGISKADWYSRQILKQRRAFLFYTSPPQTSASCR